MDPAAALPRTAEKVPVRAAPVHERIGAAATRAAGIAHRAAARARTVRSLIVSTVRKLRRSDQEEAMAGNLVHFEVPAKDPARAKEFWSGVFGWSYQPPWGEMEYHMTDGISPGGAIFGAEQTPIGHLTVYFDTDDIDRTVARVRELGGEAEDKQPIPHVGWFSRCSDSEGNAFSLFQGDEGAG
jgi:predicted enzyme related to lactoylglutathione lyase